MTFSGEVFTLSRTTTTSPPTRGPTGAYFVGLDGLRGFAVLGVLGYHFGAGFARGGYLGVDIFFVISGFVVTRNLIRLIESGNPWRRQFYGRRFSRLFPVLLALLAALLVVWVGRGSLDGAAVRAVAGSGLMSYNLAAVHWGAELEGPLHLWSLGVEWHFYLLAPVLLIVGGRRLPALARALALLALAATVAMVRLGLLLDGSISSMWIYLHTLTRLDGLLVGMALALAPLALLRRLWGRRFAAGALVGLAIAIVVGPAWGARPPVTLGVIGPLVTALTALIIVAEVSQSDSRPDEQPGRSTLEWPPLVWAGQRSYSLYLWHYFIGVTVLNGGTEAWHSWTMFVVQISLSLVVAEASYRWIERPARTAINRLL